MIVKILGGKYLLLGISILLWLSIPGIGIMIHFYRLKRNFKYKKLYQEIKLEKIKYQSLIQEKKKDLSLELDLLKKQETNSKQKHLNKVKLKSSYKKEIKNLKEKRENIIFQIQQNYLKEKS